jgi:hypothetical protein
MIIVSFKLKIQNKSAVKLTTVWFCFIFGLEWLGSLFSVFC